MSSLRHAGAERAPRLRETCSEWAFHALGERGGEEGGCLFWGNGLLSHVGEGFSGGCGGGKERKGWMAVRDGGTRAENRLKTFCFVL